MDNYSVVKYSKLKKKRKGKGRLIALLVFLFIIVFAILHVIINVNPVIKKVSEEQVRALATVAVNNAAAEVMTGNIKYGDIIEITKDNEGKVSFIQANTMTINMIARSTTLKSQESLLKIGQQGINIPVGSLSGFAFLAGRGPSIQIKVLPVGTIETSFSSEFKAAGINQTNHKIKMRIVANVSVVIPGMNRTVSTLTEILLAESIIVGEVPDTYLNSNNLDEMLNLVP